MRGMCYRKFGATPELADLPRPIARRGQVLLRVVASSVNPVDWKLASGDLWFLRPRLPYIPGFDVAGEVVEVGEGVSGFKVGDHAHARLAGIRDGGGSAEYAIAAPDVLVPIPESMDFDSAAGLPLAGMTALQGLRDVAGMPLEGAQERVLVVGASGGVGHLAVQIARAAGATVTGVCSGRNAQVVRDLGAHAVIDYTQPDATRGKGPFDIVLDCIGGDWRRWSPLLTPRGRYASVTPGAGVMLRMLANALTPRKVRPVMLQTNAADLALLDRMHAALRLRVLVDSRHALAELPAAWERSKSGRAVGKIIVRVAS